MKNLRNALNDKGLTLIELLVSLALISIVIVTFLSFFSQSVLFSSKSEDKLTAVNIAEKVIAELKSDEDLLLDLQELKEDHEELPVDLEIYPFLFEPQTINNKVYYPHVKVSTSTTEWDLDLWQVHVKIFTDEDKNYSDSNPTTELFSYLDSEKELGE